MRRRAIIFWAGMLTAIGAALTLSTLPANAHQPYCETDDLTAETAWVIRDPTVSTAYYGTLNPADDVDYFALTAQAGQEIYLQMTIPQITGQENFAPSLIVIGPGLAQTTGLPDFVPDGMDALIIPPEDATEFYEPFGGRHYWERQQQWVTLPEDGDYLIAVWNPEVEVGRYTFVYGTREVFGGELGCDNGYWVPVGAEDDTPPPPQSLLGLLMQLLGGDPAADHAPDHHDGDHARAGQDGGDDHTH